MPLDLKTSWLKNQQWIRHNGLVILGIVLLLVASGSWLIDRNRPPTLANMSQLQPRLVQILDRAFLNINKEPKKADNWGNLGQIYDANGFVQEAIESYKRAAKLDPNQPKWLYLLSLIHAKHNRMDKAQAGMERVIRLQPAYVPAYYWLGYWTLATGNTEGATAHFKGGLTVDSNYHPILQALARTYVESGDIDEAIKLLEDVFQRDVGNGYMHFLLGTAYRQQGRREDALAEFELGDTISQKIPDPWQGQRDRFRLRNASRQLAMTAFSNGQFEEAATLLEQLRETNPDDASILTNLSASYLKIGKREDALAMGELALARQPTRADVHLNLSVVHAEMGNKDLASDYAQQAIKLNPKLVPAYWMQAKLFRDDGEILDAIAQLERGLSFDPKFTGMRSMLGQLQCEADQCVKGVRNLRMATRENPNNVANLLSLAHAEAVLGCADNAQQALKAAVDKGAKQNAVSVIQKAITNSQERSKGICD